jgi:hypothetical protein
MQPRNVSAWPAILKRVLSVRKQPAPCTSKLPMVSAAATTRMFSKIPLLTSQMMSPRTMRPPPSIIIHWMLRGSSRAAIIRCGQGVTGAGGVAGWTGGGGGSRNSTTGSGMSFGLMGRGVGGGPPKITEF